MDLRDAQALQTLTRQSGKVRQPFSVRLWRKTAGRRGVVRHESLAHFRADFECLRPDARPQPGQRVPGNRSARRIRLRLQAHILVKTGLQNPLNKAPPTGVRSADSLTIAIGEQHRQTIGHPDCAHHPRRPGGASVGLQHTGLGKFAQFDRFHTMDLTQVDRLLPQRGLQPATIDIHRGRIVTGRSPQIHAIER